MRVKSQLISGIMVFLCPLSGPSEPVSTMENVNGHSQTAPVTSAQSKASAELFDSLYGELRSLARTQMARLKPGESLQATVLIHEAFLKLHALEWTSEREFFCVAASAMRSVVLDKIRASRRLKRGGNVVLITLNGLDPEDGRAQSPADILFVEELIERLGRLDPELTELVLLRYYAGLSLPRISRLLDIPLRTLERRWQFVRAYFNREKSERGKSHDRDEP